MKEFEEAWKYIKCPKCGFEGKADEEFDVAVKQIKGKYANIVNMGYKCNKCEHEWW